MPFLLHDSQLTREQRAIVELRPERHHFVLGPPGSGKTQVLLHRARWLRDRAGVPNDRFRIFVFTNVLSMFLRQSLELLRIPETNVQTFDDWCAGLWDTFVGGRKPWSGKCIDFAAVREAVANRLVALPRAAPLLDFALVDEGQDLDDNAYRILTKTVAHLTVFADIRQQIFEGGLGETGILSQLDCPHRSASLLSGYRNSPDIAKLASYFGESFPGENIPPPQERQKPCLYVASDWDDEVDQIARVLRERMRLNQKVCIIVPTNRDLHGLARRLEERGVIVEKAVPPRRGGEPADFNSLTPKIASYHSAKGLTFDCVLLPKLVEPNFAWVTGERRRRLLLVGMTRATQWVHLSTVAGYELSEFEILRQAEANGHIFVMRPAAGVPRVPAPPPAIEDGTDSFL
jgi:superfamily I DNA/RNA helicase